MTNIYPPGGGSGTADTTTFDQLFGALGNMVLPAASSSYATYSSDKSLTQFTQHGVLIRCHKTGNLRDLYVQTGASPLGNVLGAVYDTNAVANRVWLGANVAFTGAAGTAVAVGDPNLAVTIGQYYWLAVNFDNATPGNMRGISSTGSVAVVPNTNFVSPDMTDTAAQAKFWWTNAAGSMTHPSTLAEASRTAGTAQMPLIFGRIT